MAPYALLFGTLMVGVGIIGYFAPGTFGKYEDVSPTAMIPAYLGAAIILCGLVAFAKTAWRKHAMHLSAVIAVIGFVGGFMPIQRARFDFQKAGAVSGLLLSSLSLLYVLLCVRFFIAVRKARESAP